MPTDSVPEQAWHPDATTRNVVGDNAWFPPLLMEMPRGWVRVSHAASISIAALDRDEGARQCAIMFYAEGQGDRAGAGHMVSFSVANAREHAAEINGVCDMIERGIDFDDCLRRPPARAPR